MKKYRGIAVAPGSRVGRAAHLEEVPYAVESRAVPPEDVPKELERLRAAFLRAKEGLDETRRALAADPGAASVFDVHRMMLEAVEAEVSAAVEGGDGAEHAVATVLRGHANRFAQRADPLLAERRQDVLDLEKRLLRALSGAPSGPSLPSGRGPTVVVAEDLTPAETAALGSSHVVGLVLEHGGPTSHTAILAKSLGLPCVMGVPGIVAAVPPGALVWVDGDAGAVVVEPDVAAREEARRAAERHEARERGFLRETDLPAETLDGHAVVLLANVELPVEVEAAAARGAAGIGLFRTEFLYDPARGAPTEDEHLAAYRAALAAIPGGRLTVRTFDFGSDKAAPGGGAHEANPALGVRSLRWCFANVDAFLPQLRACLRVAAEGDVRVMLPMVGSLDDVRRARALLARAAEALAREGVRHRPDPPVGAMVEVPAAAVTADLLAREVDFFSLGTNDLMQYGLAVDRTNENVAGLFRPSHPSVLRLVREVLDAARDRSRPVTMCGEMGGDPAYAILLLGIGLRELSLTPASIPRIRRLVRSLTIARARAVAARCQQLATADEVDRYLADALAAPRALRA
jgi:phosphotransferase system enzyme I (PtsI)